MTSAQSETVQQLEAWPQEHPSQTPDGRELLRVRDQVGAAAALKWWIGYVEGEAKKPKAA